MKIPLLDSLPPKGRRWLLWSAGLLLFYTVFGFLILPLILRAVAVRQISRQLDREVSIASVRLNPYAFSATVRGVLIKDKDGQPLVTWDEVYVNFQLMSFLGRPWVFREIRATKPFVRVQVNQDYSLNCSDLIDKFSQTGTNAPSSSKPLALRIDHFRIAGARASFTDLTPRLPFTRLVGPVEITLNQFQTDPAHRDAGSFSGTTDAGERFAWSGYFFLNPIRSAGEFSLENLSLNKFAPLYQDFVRFGIRDGTIDLRGAYEFVRSASNHVALLTNFNFNLRSLKIA